MSPLLPNNSKGHRSLFRSAFESLPVHGLGSQVQLILPMYFVFFKSLDIGFIFKHSV